jgi:hypothetical protein
MALIRAAPHELRLCHLQARLSQSQVHVEKGDAMELDIRFKDDIVNILCGADQAETDLFQACRLGFVAALATLARGLGMPVSELERQLAVAGPGAGGGAWDRRLALRAVWRGGQRWEK